MPVNPIKLPDLIIFNIKADLVKGSVDITLRGRLTLDFMKLRPQLMDLALNDKPCSVEITPPLSLFDEITLRSGDREVTLTSATAEHAEQMLRHLDP